MEAAELIARSRILDQVSEPRTRVDACPGALQVHQAADGGLARVRLPGGMVLPAQLDVLADAAEQLADGALELTSRGNVQLRALPAGAELELAERLADAGLLPSVTHETARNLVASPLSGRRGGLVDVRPLVTGFDAAMLADPALASLPGRFLASFDDGSGDVTPLGADVGLHAVDQDTLALVLVGADSGLRTTAADAVDRLIRAARAFGEIRGPAWRLAEVPDGVTQVRDALGAAVARPVDLAGQPQAPVGWLTQDDGLVSIGAVVPLGRLDALTARFLAAVQRPLVVTPWRGIVVADLTEDVADSLLRVVAPRGLVFDAGSPWATVTACAGRPGCAKSLADVRADAAVAVADGTLPAGQVHFAGCERRCGRPKGDVTDVVATPAGYRVG